MNPYRLLGRAPVRPQSTGGRVANTQARAPSSSGTASQRVNRAERLTAAYGNNPGSPDAGYKIPSPPKGRSRTTPNWGDEYTVNTDKVQEDLREAKNALSECRIEVLHLRAENVRLDQTVREQERRIMRLSEGVVGQEYAVDARRAVEKCVLVRQLKEQIIRLRAEVSDNVLALKNIQRSAKANAVTQLSVEKEEYYFECLRLRQVVISLRQDMAADIASRQHSQVVGARQPRQGNDVENGLRLEISRLAAGFQDILFEMSGKNTATAQGAAVDGDAPDIAVRAINEGVAFAPDYMAVRRDAAVSPKSQGQSKVVAAAAGGGRFLRVNYSSAMEMDPPVEVHADALYVADNFSSVGFDRLQRQQLDEATEISVHQNDRLSKSVRGFVPELEAVESPRSFSVGVAVGDAHQQIGNQKTERSLDGAKAKTPVPPKTQKSTGKQGKSNSLRASKELRDVKESIQVAAADEAAVVFQPSDEEKGVGEDSLHPDEGTVPDRSATLLDEKKRQYLVQQMRNTFRRVLYDGTFDMDALFNHLDEDSDGKLTATEIHRALGMLPAFSEVDMEQVKALLEELDDDNNGWISMAEFKEFVKSEQKTTAQIIVKDTHKAARKQVAARNTRATTGGSDLGGEFLKKNATMADFARGVRFTFSKTMAEGYSLEELFAEIDDDGDGLLSASELQRIFARFRYFKNVSVDEISALLQKIATTYNKDAKEPTMQDFKAFLETEEKEAGASVIGKMLRKKLSSKVAGYEASIKIAVPAALSPSKLPKKPEMREKIVDRLEDHPDTGFAHKTRHIFRQLVKSGGISIEELFASVDSDGNGFISVDELQSMLSKQTDFKSLTMSEFGILFQIIDSDANGEVSIDEFKDFVHVEKKHAAAATLQAQLRGRVARRQVQRKTVYKRGEKVEGKYGGGSKWFPATVQSVNARDGAYFLVYDDGDEEKDALEENIRPIQTSRDSGEPSSCRVSPPLPKDDYDDDFEDDDLEEFDL